MKHKPFFLFFLLMLVASVLGCGYTQKSVLPRDIKTIYVDTVKNKISIDTVYAYEPGLEMKITQAIIRRLNQDGNLRVVSNKEQADAVLETDLTKFEQGGLRFSSLESVEEYRMFVVVAARLLDAKNAETIWTEPEFSGDAEYFVSSIRSISRSEAADRAVDRLARNLVDRVVEDW